MTLSLSSRLVGFSVVAVALTAGIDFWSALHAIQLQRLQQVSWLLQQFAGANGFDGTRLTRELEVVAPGSIVHLVNVSSLAAGKGAHGIVSNLVPQSLLGCLAAEGRPCVWENLVAIKFHSSAAAGQVAIAALGSPPWKGLALSIGGTALAVCLLLSLVLQRVLAICLLKPLRYMEQATDNFVSNGFHSFEIALPSSEPSTRFFSEGTELRSLASSVGRMASALREWRQKIADRERQHLRWFSYLSHDLKAPLERVLARLQAIKCDSNLWGDHLARLLDSAHLEVTQLEDVIGSISRFAMLESDSDIQCNFMETTLNTLLEHAVDVFEFEACQKGVELDLWIGSDIGTVRIDKNLLRRAVENLIANAVRFAPEGGLVSVRAERSESVVLVSVSDSGLGISAQDLPRIFDFAFRGEQPTRPRCAGSMGLGLALVKRVAELHQGEVAVRNLETQGAEFVISLPVIQ